MKHLECNTDLDYQISIGDMETLNMGKITRVQIDPIYRGNIKNLVIYADEGGAIDLRIWPTSGHDPLIIPIIGHDACINPELPRWFMKESKRIDKGLPVVGRFAVPINDLKNWVNKHRPRMDDAE